VQHSSGSANSNIGAVTRNSLGSRGFSGVSTKTKRLAGNCPPASRPITARHRTRHVRSSGRVDHFGAAAAMRRRNSSTKDLRGAGTGSLECDLGSAGCDDSCVSGKTGSVALRSSRIVESAKPNSAANSFSLVRCRFCLGCATDWLSARHLRSLGELARQLTGVLCQ